MIPQYPLCLCFFRLYHTLSLFFQLVSFVLVGVAAYARVVTVVTSLALVGGVISCGVFLFFTALIGLIGACRHHQVLLFFVSLETFLRQIFYIVTFFFSILEHSVKAWIKKIMNIFIVEVMSSQFCHDLSLTCGS